MSEIWKDDFRDQMIPEGTECFFEYHCWESHQSSDAELWYHSHQRVKVGHCVNPEHYEPGESMWTRIAENAAPLIYSVVFADGFECAAFEDELLLSESDYERKDPPTGSPDAVHMAQFLTSRRFTNRDNDPRGPWQPVSAFMQASDGTPNQYYRLISPSGKAHYPPHGRCWIFSIDIMRKEIAAKNIWFGKDGNEIPRIKRFLMKAEQA